MEFAAGTVALVPGGAGGVGREVVAALLARGLRPVLLGRDEARLREAGERLGPGVELVAADITDRDAITRAVAEVTERMGPPLVLVNCAGAAGSAPLLPPDDALWERMLRVNAWGAWVVTTACVERMLKAEGGFVCHVASTAALRGFRYTAGYVASKHALLGLCRALAEELAGRGVRANAVCPGFLDSEMTRRTIAHIREKTGMSEARARTSIEQMNASGRLIQPAEVARAVGDLLDDPTAHAREIVLE